MKDAIKTTEARIQKLSEEVARLIEDRNQCVEKTKQIGTRLDQLAGAIHELNKLLIDLSKEKKEE